MNRFEKHAKYIMKRGDKILAEKEKKNKTIRRISFSFAGIFAVVIVGFFAWKSIPPRTEFPSDIVIPESTTINSSTYINKTSPQTTALVTSSSIKNSKTEVSHITTATIITKTTTAATKISDTYTTKITTSRTAQITETTPVTSQTKTESTTIVVTTVTTTSDGYSGTDGDSIVYMGKKYRITGRNFTDVELNELPNSQMPVPPFVSQGQSMQLKLYEISGVSTDYAVAALIDNDPVYTLCLGHYIPGTVQSLFSDTALNNYWSINRIFEGRNEISNIDTDTQARVFEILLNIPDMENSKGVSLGNTLMKIELKSDVLGDSTVELTEKGFLSTNIGGYYSSYLIGRDELDMIIENIKNEIM